MKAFSDRRKLVVVTMFRLKKPVTTKQLSKMINLQARSICADMVYLQYNDVVARDNDLFNLTRTGVELARKLKDCDFSHVITEKKTTNQIDAIVDAIKIKTKQVMFLGVYIPIKK